jgi:hypothetical protein
MSSRAAAASADEDYGHGPWFAALIHDHKMQLSDIIVHTYPELIAAAINFNNQNQTQWEVIMCVGPFETLDACTQYSNRWNRNKQLKTRVENGQKLYYRLRDTGGGACRMWHSTTTTATAMTEASSTLPFLLSETAGVSVGHVFELQDKRKLKA